MHPCLGNNLIFERRFVNDYQKADQHYIKHIPRFGTCDSYYRSGGKMMDEKKVSNRGGAREGAGRPKGDDPTKKFSMSARLSEYEIIEQAAKKAEKTVSRYLVELALKDNGV